MIAMARFGAAAAATVLLLAATAGPAAADITRFDIPTANSLPFGIAAGPDGALWFTEFSANKIGRITTAGTITEFALPAGSQPLSITAGSDGALWFTEFGTSKIGRITTAGALTEFATAANSQPFGITAGPDGNLWYTEANGNHISFVTIAGTVHTGFIDAAAPRGITTGPDGALWFTQNGGTQPAIVRLTTAGQVTGFNTPAKLPASGITVGPDGALWLVLSNGDIGRITTAGMFFQFTGLGINAGQGVQSITAGPDGAMWFVVLNSVGRAATAAGNVSFASSAGSPNGIAAGPDGALWYTDRGFNQIVRLGPDPSATPLFAATLPGSRSVQVGHPATAFASIINTGPSSISCGPVPVTTVPATFAFQTTDPKTNALIGTQNTRVPIPSGATQSFVVAFTPVAPQQPINVAMGYDCANEDAASTIVGVNTLLLSFDTNPVADMIAVGLTPSNDGFAHPAPSDIFVIAASNVGAAAPITAQVRLLNPSMPLTALVCESNPTTGQCKAPPAPSVSRIINANENTTWTAFLTSTGQIGADPAKNRVIFQFVGTLRGGGPVVRGATSTAVSTPAL